MRIHFAQGIRASPDGVSERGSERGVGTQTPTHPQVRQLSAGVTRLFLFKPPICSPLTLTRTASLVQSFVFHFLSVASKESVDVVSHIVASGCRDLS